MLPERGAQFCRDLLQLNRLAGSDGLFNKDENPVLGSLRLHGEDTCIRQNISGLTRFFDTWNPVLRSVFVTLQNPFVPRI